MLPVVAGARRTALAILVNSLALAASSLVPWGLGLLGNTYAVIALGLAMALLGFNVKLLVAPTRRWAGWNFAMSIPYLLGLFVAVFADRHW